MLPFYYTFKEIQENDYIVSRQMLVNIYVSSPDLLGKHQFHFDTLTKDYFS